MITTGQKVDIYHDPITGEWPEGTATLIAQHREDVGDGLSIWHVEFDDEPGSTYLRTINEANANEAAR
jgi:hypothetical protein